jgi:hypothetical protein
MITTSKSISIVLVVLIFLLSTCKANISQNQDGSFDVETTISQEELQEVITASIADPLIREITVSPQEGYVLVTGVRERLNNPGKTDSLSFRLDLGVSNGQLTATISNAQLDGHSIEQNRLDNWNQTIANRIAYLGQNNQNSTLKSVSITPEVVTILWNVTRS